MFDAVISNDRTIDREYGFPQLRSGPRPSACKTSRVLPDRQAELSDNHPLEFHKLASVVSLVMQSPASSRVESALPKSCVNLLIAFSGCTVLAGWTRKPREINRFHTAVVPSRWPYEHSTHIGANGAWPCQAEIRFPRAHTPTSLEGSFSTMGISHLPQD